MINGKDYKQYKDEDFHPIQTDDTSGWKMKYLLILLTLISTLAQANSYGLYNYNSSEYIEGNHINESRSIASITKLFTVVTVLRSGQELTDNITMECVGRAHIPRRSKISRLDLMVASMVASDNCAAETLAINYPGGVEKFNYDRNEFLQSHGLVNTHLSDPSGLSIFNTSTINDLVKFISIAYQDETLKSIANLADAKITVYKKNKKQIIRLRNTNPAILTHNNIVLSKTGFTNSAGRCVVMIVRRFNEYYAVVILGEPNARARAKSIEKLLSYETKS